MRHKVSLMQRGLSGSRLKELFREGRGGELSLTREEGQDGDPGPLAKRARKVPRLREDHHTLNESQPENRKT